MPSRAEKVKALALRPGTQGEGAAAASALTRVAAAVDQQPGRKRLTDSTIAKPLAPSKGNRVYYDLPDAKGGGWTAGFGLRITAKGAKAFVLNYRSREGRAGRVTIGSPPAWSTHFAARARAKELKRAVDAGGDPAKEDRDVRAAATVSDSVRPLSPKRISTGCARRRDAITKRSSAATSGRSWESAEGRRRQHADIDQLTVRLTRAGTPVTANRCVALLRNCSRPRSGGSSASANPAPGVERNAEHPRHRYLSEDELNRLKRALAAHPDRQAAEHPDAAVADWRTQNRGAVRHLGSVPCRYLGQRRPARPSKRTAPRPAKSPPALALLESLRDAAPKDAVLVPRIGQARAPRRTQERLAGDLQGGRAPGFSRPRSAEIPSRVSPCRTGASLPMVGACWATRKQERRRDKPYCTMLAMREATGRVGDNHCGQAAQGGAAWLDYRLPFEFDAFALHGLMSGGTA